MPKLSLHTESDPKDKRVLLPPGQFALPSDTPLQVLQLSPFFFTAAKTGQQSW